MPLMEYQIDSKGPNFTVQVHNADETFYQIQAIQPIPSLNQIIFNLTHSKH